MNIVGVVIAVVVLQRPQESEPRSFGHGRTVRFVSLTTKRRRGFASNDAKTSGISTDTFDSCVVMLAHTSTCQRLKPTLRLCSLQYCCSRCCDLCSLRSSACIAVILSRRLSVMVCSLLAEWQRTYTKFHKVPRVDGRTNDREWSRRFCLMTKIYYVKTKILLCQFL